MENDTRPLDRENLKFYATISALISHEIKNSLAVLNESAGLLEDYILMAKDGKPDPERMMHAVQSVLKHVKRADDTVKRMNRFAHSHDHDAQQVDLAALASLMCALIERDAVRQGVGLKLLSGQCPVMVKTIPYRLEFLISLLLYASMANCGGEKTITLKVEATSQGARISFSGLDPENLQAADFSLPVLMRRLQDELNGQLDVVPVQGEIRLTLPFEGG